jgi:adenylate kinase family enzyme
MMGVGSVFHAWGQILLTLLSMNVETQEVPMVVVFGRPGAGKTTIADRAVECVASSAETSLQPIGLDLDVCVPDWMKENFAKGIYPTLQERQAFATSACDYVDDCIRKATGADDAADPSSSSSSRQVVAGISFSFVNTDLRDTFRQRFPKASWFLVEVSEDIATERIQRREGHFYNGKVELPSTEGKAESSHPRGDNDDWSFAPVTFPHTILDGVKPIDENAETVAQGLLEAAAKHIER